MEKLKLGYLAAVEAIKKTSTLFTNANTNNGHRGDQSPGAVSMSDSDGQMYHIIHGVPTGKQGRMLRDSWKDSFDTSMCLGQKREILYA